MAPRKGDEYVKLGVETDEQSFAQYETRLNAVIQKAQALQVGLGRAYVEGNAAAQKAKASFDVATQSLDKQSKVAKAVKKDYEDIGDAADKAAKKSSSITIGQGARAGASVARLAGNIQEGDIPGTLVSIAKLKDELGSIGENLASVVKGSESFGAALAGVGAELGPILLVAVPVAVALGGVKLALDSVKKSADDAAAAQKVQFDQEQEQAAQKKQNRGQSRTLSTEQNQQIADDAFADAVDLTKRIADKKKEIEDNNKKYADLGGALNPGERSKLGSVGQELQKELDQLIDERNKEFKVNQNAVNILKPLVKTREDEEKAAEDAKKAAEDAKKAIEEEQKRWHDYFAVRHSMLEDHLKDQEKAAAAEQDRNEKLVGILQKRDADIDAIQKRRDDAEIELQRKTADTVARIVEQTIEANEAEFRKLQQRQDELLTQGGRADDAANRKAEFDDLQLQIDDNRKERDELKAHQKKVRDIKRGDQAAERDAVYDRNFDALFRLQENKTEQENIENQTYEDQKEARLEAQKDQRDDLTRQRNFERNERRIALNNSLSDARKAYYDQLKLQNDAAQIAIRKTYESAKVELDLLNAKTVAEINLVSQTEAVKQQIFIKYLNEAKAMLGEAPVVYQNPNVEGTVGGSVGNTQGGHSNFFATGGWADKPFVYNDDKPKQMESFGGVRLPGGMGIAIPFRSGTVDSGGSGGDTYQVQMTFTGNNPQAIAEAVDRRLATRFKKMVKK